MLKEYLSTLANAFRNKLGTTEKINAQNFPDKVTAVYDKGFNDGKEQGGNTEEAYNQGFAAGKKAEYDEFWDSYQDFGKKTHYGTAFYNSSWNDTTFKPKYDIRPTSMGQTFRDCDITDLVSILQKQNVVLDTSNCTYFYYTFALSSLTHLGVIDTRSASALQNTFQNCSSLHTIDELILKEDGTQTFAQTFNSDTQLTNIKITGVIGTTISFVNSSKLTHDSLMSIINALAVVSTTQTLTLHATAKARLTDEEKAIATNKGWTLA